MKDADLFTPDRPHSDPGRMSIHEIEQPGRRVLRAASVLTNDEPGPLLVVWSCFADDPPLPLTAHCVSFPAASLPELVEALTALGGEK
jgi:hypothetical protein